MRVLLIDLSHLWWAAWHGNGDSEVSRAAEVTLDKVRWVMDTVPHDAHALCCDHPPYWRSELNPSYKAQRAEASEAAIEQFRRVREKLAAGGHLLWRIKGLEADDIIAHACRVATERGDTVTIATNDKDLLQLVSDTVAVFSVKTGDVIVAEGVREKFGVEPVQMAQLLALAGDKSDNVDGIPGVGAKTAAKLISEFGGAEEAIKAAREDNPKITPKLRENLSEHWRNYGAALAQVELTRDAPIDYDELTQERTPAQQTEVDWGAETLGGDDMGDPQETTNTEPAPPPETAPEADMPKGETGPGSEQPRRELVRHQPAELASWERQLEPSDAKEAWGISKALYDARLWSQFGSREAIFAIILRGRALGMETTTALSAFHIVEGRPTMHSDLIVARVLASGKAEYFDRVESTAEKAVFVTKRKDGRREIVEEFTIEDACHAGLVSRDSKGRDGFSGRSRSGKPSNWDKYRKQMLRHRCASALARSVYPDVVLGLYTPDEVSNGEDIADAEFTDD